MTARSHSNGHPIEWTGKVWTDAPETCAKCGRKPAIVGIKSKPGSTLHEYMNVDICIAPIVQALNHGGIRTEASCCGHGNQPGTIALEDGRELFVVPDFETSRKIGKLFPPIHGKEDYDHNRQKAGRNVSRNQS